ncbi:ribonuclease III [Thermorudis peleae]|uniref:ribonuclease III n=1 Tax=Thermorudis peleae TaxID=1382356 RepID=UPI000689DEF0|nr:ribonuclease III [Thermorudis peleae]
MSATADATMAKAGELDERLALATQRLGVQFRDVALLRRALTHLSYVNEQGLSGEAAVAASNERLEFVGDAVLGLLAAEFLYQRFPRAPEGDLTAYRTALVRTQTLARWARELELDQCLYLGHGERPRPGQPVRDRILAGAFEAVLAAIYLDRGIRTARRFLARFLKREADEGSLVRRIGNYKGRLQEWTQERLHVTPVYATLEEVGPAHQRMFTVAVQVGEVVLGIGQGPSKRAAEQEAARQALERLQAEEARGRDGTL